MVAEFCERAPKAAPKSRLSRPRSLRGGATAGGFASIELLRSEFASILLSRWRFASCSEIDDCRLLEAFGEAGRPCWSSDSCGSGSITAEAIGPAMASETNVSDIFILDGDAGWWVNRLRDGHHWSYHDRVAGGALFPSAEIISDVMPAEN